MGAALFDDYFPSFVVASAFSYYITGSLFCLWFLNLLIFQSVSSKFPRIVLLLLTKFLMIWLLIMIVVFVLTLFVITKYKNVAIYSKEYRLLLAGILCSAFGIVMTSYSFWILESYINLLEEEAYHNTRVTFFSFPSDDFGELVSDLPKLATQPPALQENVIKSLKNGYRKLRPSLVHQLDPSNIRPSQISIMSSSHLSVLSGLPATQSPEGNSVISEETEEYSGSGSSQQKNSLDNN